jgi:hypothetical protein
MKQLFLLMLTLIACSSATPEDFRALTVAACANAGTPDGRDETTCMIERSGAGYRVTLAGQSYTSGSVEDARNWCCARGATQERATDDTECLGANPCPGVVYQAAGARCRQDSSSCLCGDSAVDQLKPSASVVSACADRAGWGCDTFSGLCRCMAGAAVPGYEVASCP